MLSVSWARVGQLLWNSSVGEECLHMLKLCKCVSLNCICVQTCACFIHTRRWYLKCGSLSGQTFLFRWAGYNKQSRSFIYRVKIIWSGLGTSSTGNDVGVIDTFILVSQNSSCNPYASRGKTSHEERADQVWNAAWTILNHPVYMYTGG